MKLEHVCKGNAILATRCAEKLKEYEACEKVAKDTEQRYHLLLAEFNNVD